MSFDPARAGQVVSCSFCQFPFQLVYPSSILPHSQTNKAQASLPAAKPFSLDFDSEEAPEPKRTRGKKYGEKASTEGMGTIGKIVSFCLLMIGVFIAISVLKKSDTPYKRGYDNGKELMRQYHTGDKTANKKNAPHLNELRNYTEAQEAEYMQVVQDGSAGKQPGPRYKRE